MNEKSRKYLHLKNDKNLIGGQTPKESDLENFEKWKKRMRKNKLQLIILSSFILILVYGMLLITGVFLEAELKEKIFGIGSLFIFLYFESVLIKQYLYVKSWKMEYCTYGKVIDKYTMPKGDRRDYYIVIHVNDNELKVNSKSEYSLLNIDDDVIVFSIEGNNKAYVTKND